MPWPAGPGATVRAEGSLEDRDSGLNSSAEIPQALIDPVALSHRQNGMPALLGKDCILNLVRLGEVPIVLRGEPAIGCYLTRHTPKKLLLAFKEYLVTITVRRIARLDETIENQGRWAAREKYFMAEGGVPLPLDDNGAVLLEKEDDLFRGRYGFAVDHAALDLVDDLTQQTDGPLQICRDPLGTKELKALVSSQFGNRRQGIVNDAFGIMEQILIGGFADRLFSSIENGHHPLFDHTVLVAVAVGRDWGEGLPGTEPAGNNPDAVGQKSEICWVVDVGFDGR